MPPATGSKPRSSTQRDVIGRVERVSSGSSESLRSERSINEYWAAFSALAGSSVVVS